MSLREWAREINDPHGTTSSSPSEPKPVALPRGQRTGRRRHRLGPWLERNCWRLGPGLAVVAAVWWARLPGVWPWGELGRGVVNRLASVSPVGWPDPGAPSVFDACWSGGEGPCWPGWEPLRDLLRLAVFSAAVLLVWWRLSEFPSGPGRVGQFFVARRRFRLLLHVEQQWRAGLVRLGHTHNGRPLARLSRLRVDAAGAVVADFKLTPDGNFGRLFRRKESGELVPQPAVGQLRTSMKFQAGHRRRVEWSGWLRPLGVAVSFVLGDARYRLWPSDIAATDNHPRGGRYRRARIMFPTLDADLIPADPEPAPSPHEVRLAVGEDVVLWDRAVHPHAAAYGPTNRGKGHVLRRVASQCLQGWVSDGSGGVPAGERVAELVVCIDGQMGPEHAVWAGLSNYWWFDPDRVGAGLPQWARDCLTPAQVAEVLRDVPAERYIEVAHLVYVRNQLRAVIALGRPRGSLVRKAGVGGWRELRASVRKAYPRIDVLVDETNSLLMKGAGPGNVGDALRKEIGALLGALLFQGSKYGISVFMAAQIMYEKAWLADGARAQIGRAVWLGNAPVEHRKMVSAVTDWPTVPDRAGDGVEFAYAAGNVRACRFPFFPIHVARGVRRRLEDEAGVGS